VSKLNHKNTPKKIDISKKGVNYSLGGPLTHTLLNTPEVTPTQPSEHPGGHTHTLLNTPVGTPTHPSEHPGGHTHTLPNTPEDTWRIPYMTTLKDTLEGTLEDTLQENM
jgi:hypothetical protein